jgi:hypothetical protein
MTAALWDFAGMAAHAAQRHTELRTALTAAPGAAALASLVREW